MSKYVNVLVTELIEAIKNKRITWKYNIYSDMFYTDKDNLPFQIVIIPPTHNLFDLFKGFFPTIRIKQRSDAEIYYTLYSWKLGNYLIRTIKRSMEGANFIYDLIDVIDVFVQERQKLIALDQDNSIKELPSSDKE